MANLYDRTANVLTMLVNSVNFNQNIFYVADTTIANAIMEIDCTNCTSPGTNNISVSANFKLGNTRYIAPNTTVLF